MSEAYDRDQINERITELYAKLIELRIDSIGNAPEIKLLEGELRGWQYINSLIREHGGMSSIVDE